MPGLPLIVLSHRELPTGIVMRVRHHNHLQLLRVPLVAFVTDSPSLLPRPAVDVGEFNLVVKLLGGDVHSGAGDVVVLAGFSGDGLTWWLGGADRRPGVLEAGGDRVRDAVAEEEEEEEEEGDGEADGEEVGEEEVAEEQASPGLSGVLGFGGGGGGGEERVGPRASAASAEGREGHGFGEGMGSRIF